MQQQWPREYGTIAHLDLYEVSDRIQFIVSNRYHPETGHATYPRIEQVFYGEGKYHIVYSRLTMEAARTLRNRRAYSGPSA